MRLVKLGLVSTNPVVGDMRANVDTMIGFARQLGEQHVTIAAFPEQGIGGYPAEDLVQWHSFVEAQRAELHRFMQETMDIATVFVVGLVVRTGGQLFNVAGVVHRGRVLGYVPKEKLPTYSVFYERRTFSRGAPHMHRDAGHVPLGDYLFTFDAFTLAVEVCEDAWSPDGPMRRRCYSGADVVVNISASPFRVGVQDTRREMLATRSADTQATLVYVNRVGGQDGLVFDGGGFVFQNGRPALEAPRFVEAAATCVVDLGRTQRLRTENTTWRSDCEAFAREEHPVPQLRAAAETDRSVLRYPVPPSGSFFLPSSDGVAASPRDAMLDELFEALALGAKDYMEKARRFERFGIALSGGRDSLLSLLVAWRAVQLRHPAAAAAALREYVGREITAFFMPTRFTKDASRAAAERIAEELGVSLHELSIDDAFEREAAAATEMLGGPLDGTTRQNIQARLRGLRMWNWSNAAAALFLQTSDMSEKAAGYVTIGGDLEGGLSVIANVPKTVVTALLERLHTRFALGGIALTLATTPSPELAPGQSAEEELMPFPVLDACLHLHAGEKLDARETAEVLAAVFPSYSREQLERWTARFLTLFAQSVYKWVQAPLALHVGALDLDRERALQLPVLWRTGWETR